MVKPQSSKLITRVRFPSSPRDLGSRRFRVEALSFSLEGMTGIPSACGFVSSRARNPHAPARHPLHKSRSRLPGIAYGRKYIPSRARDFHPPARHPLENYPERICRNPFRMRICFLARSESARASLLTYTPQAPAAPRQSWRIHRATPQHCRGAPSPGKENRRHHQKAQRLRRHPQQEPPENHNLPPSAQW